MISAISRTRQEGDASPKSWDHCKIGQMCSRFPRKLDKRAPHLHLPLLKQYGITSKVHLHWRSASRRCVVELISSTTSLPRESWNDLITNGLWSVGRAHKYCPQRAYFLDVGCGYAQFLEKRQIPRGAKKWRVRRKRLRIVCKPRLRSRTIDLVFNILM
jgi:hypothetical protein